jgi:hypothetical protein
VPGGEECGTPIICESCVNCKVYGFTKRVAHQKIYFIAVEIEIY